MISNTPLSKLNNNNNILQNLPKDKKNQFWRFALDDVFGGRVVPEWWWAYWNKVQLNDSSFRKGVGAK